MDEVAATLLALGEGTRLQVLVPAATDSAEATVRTEAGEEDQASRKKAAEVAAVTRRRL